jgi:hypothetical protein
MRRGGIVRGVTAAICRGRSISAATSAADACAPPDCLAASSRDFRRRPAPAFATALSADLPPSRRPEIQSLAWSRCRRGVAAGAAATLAPVGRKRQRLHQSYLYRWRSHPNSRRRWNRRCHFHCLCCHCQNCHRHSLRHCRSWRMRGGVSLPLPGSRWTGNATSGSECRAENYSGASIVHSCSQHRGCWFGRILPGTITSRYYFSFKLYRKHRSCLTSANHIGAICCEIEPIRHNARFA